jgi:hypothetical protein
MKNADPSKDTIDQLSELDFQIIDLFDQIETINTEEFEEAYCYHVGFFSKLLRKLLDQYHDEKRTKDDQKMIKPYLLYFREIQQYLVFFVRFPSALYQKNHPYLKELRDLIDKFEFHIKNKYKEKAIQESMLFETDFREKLEKTLSRRMLRNEN